ncbi:MAG: hypothetical protein HOO10_02485 [Candidatus Marinimicrobia bacterium]|jgi:hypothetical protein|nr:hypothetical protein [Candidatus Neomarinimicrobiota bacterium]
MDNSFEQELTQLNQLDIPSIDGVLFTHKLHSSMKKQIATQRQMVTTFAASIFILFLGIATFYQLDSTMGHNTYYAEIESTYFDMDFWANDLDELLQENGDFYYEHLTILLLDENIVWDSINFLDEMNYLTTIKDI